MIIDIRDNRLVIIGANSSLDAVGRSQFSFWNFQYDYPTEIYSSPLDQSLFLKVTQYLSKEGFNPHFEPAAQQYLMELQVQNLNFDNIRKVAAKYKDGKFDKLAFENFRKFIVTNIKRTLKSHQLKAAYHLYLLGNGANFSVPGSGKTTVVLSVYEKLRLEGKVNTLFVVGPPSCFGPWRHEFFETLGRRPKSVVLAGGNKTVRKSNYYENSNSASELYLTSFQSLLYDQNDAEHFLNQKHVKAFFVIDEAHYIKQINGNWAQALLKQSENTKYRCVLTGTPMPKSYSDIFNLFDFLWPQQKPLSQSNKSLVQYNEARGNRHSVKTILDNNIGPLFYRVRKTDLNLQPQNFLKPELIRMGKHERTIYDATYTRIKAYAKQEYYKNIEFVEKLGRGRIMRLRQAISYAKLLNTAIDDYSEKLFEDLTDLKYLIKNYDKLEVPSKIKFLIKQIRSFQNKKLKVVIWSNFIGTIHLIEKHLVAEGFYCKKIFGDTPVEGTTLRSEQTREKIRDEFVDPESGLDILIANPAACAESISLHKTCHNAIYYDLTYNCAQYLQSLDRIHRVGGSEQVGANYMFLQYSDTIDADIKRNIDSKTQKMFNIIEEDYPIYSLNMSEADGDAEAYKRIFTSKKSGRKK